MLIKNQPNAAKLLSSLRNTGYDSYSAIEDIIDNSIDAGARKINIMISTVDKEPQIIIADDGSGMTKEILDEALKLGSATEKDEVSDLGKYGMGLCTASISMAKHLKVITKQNGEYLSSVQDLDEVIKANDFIKQLGESKKEDIDLFDSIIKSSHGTLVVLEKIDRLSNTNLSIFANYLSKELGRIFRKFIFAGIEFRVNDKKIEAIDPLTLPTVGESQVYSDEEYELSVGKGNEKIHVKIVLLPDVSQQMAKELKMNIQSQGFYVLRNNREIANGVALDVFKKHNDFNRLRLELSFTSTLDNEMGVRFTKDGIEPNQAITDFLKNEIGGQVASIRKLLLKKQRADEAKEINHEESAAVIAKKTKLLITPDVVIEKRGPKTNKHENKEKTQNKSEKDRTPKETKTSSSGLGARFETLSMGREGSLYDCYQEGKVIVVQWNVDHPFYEKIVLANKENKDITTGIDFLVYALASAELKTSNDDNIELINTIKTIMSSNLRALLS